MTPEEQFTKIENSIHALLSVQAQHDTALRRQTENLGILAENMGTLVRKVDALSDIVRSHEGRIEALIDTVEAHEGKIEALVDTVDRIIRRGERRS